jgi:hypothetical protein
MSGQQPPSNQRSTNFNLALATVRMVLAENHCRNHREAPTAGGRLR